jgi:hypothetical protein
MLITTAGFSSRIIRSKKPPEYYRNERAGNMQFLPFAEYLR